MTGDDVAVYIDGACMFLMFALPIWAVMRFRIVGLFAGAALTWMIGFLGRSAMDRIDSVDGGLASAVAFFLGWIFNLSYSALIYAVTLLFFSTRRRAAQAGDPIPVPTPTPWLHTLLRLHPAERIGLACVLVFVLFLVYANYM